MPAIRSRSLSALVAVALMACGGGGGNGPTGPGPGPGPGPSPNPSANTVTMGASSFVPPSLTIQAGGTVTWNNPSGQTHNVTFQTSGAPSNIPDHNSGSSSRTFPNAGTFNYHCTLHGGMNGSVVVQ